MQIGANGRRPHAADCTFDRSIGGRDDHDGDRLIRWLAMADGPWTTDLEIRCGIPMQNAEYIMKIGLYVLTIINLYY